MAKVLPDQVEGSIRRSARKRRAPGEWWKEFSTEEENTITPTALSLQDVSLGRHVEEDNYSPHPENSQSVLSEEPLQSPRISGGVGRAPDPVSSHKRRSSRNISANKVGNAATKPDLKKVKSGTGEGTTNQIRPDESHVNSDDSEVTQQDQPTSDRHQGSFSRVATKANSFTSHPSAPNSRSGVLTDPSSETRGPVSFSDKSSLTTANPSSFLVSFQTDAAEDEPPHGRVEHQDEETRFDVDKHSMATDQENTWEGNQSDYTAVVKSGGSRNRIDENDRMNGYEDDQRFASAQVLTANENLVEGVQECTPQPSRRLFSREPTDGFGLRHRDFSKIGAPRKSRSKPDSPSYSFSLRSRRGSPDFLAAVQKLSRNPQKPGETKRNRSRCTQQKALVAKRSALMYSSVAAYVGTVKVAISISLNKTTMGEVVLLPRSATGPRRALTGDEFYIVKQGYVECDIGFMSVTLFAGDHLGIPEGQTFEMRNPSASKCELFFFSPRGL